jgi:hypothetical protein
MPTQSQWTPYGKRLIAFAMCENGKSFIGAAILLRQHGSDEYPVLHLICQGIEVLGKGLLLVANYEKYQPLLRRYGHNLVKVTKAIENELGVKILNPTIMQELDKLNGLYSNHHFRYASGINVLVDAKSISSSKVLRRTTALMRLAARNSFFRANAI